jgi:hypothetical protein
MYHNLCPYLAYQTEPYAEKKNKFISIIQFKPGIVKKILFKHGEVLFYFCIIVIEYCVLLRVNLIFF